MITLVHQVDRPALLGQVGDDADLSAPHDAAVRAQMIAGTVGLVQLLGFADDLERDFGLACERLRLAPLHRAVEI